MKVAHGPDLEKGRADRLFGGHGADSFSPARRVLMFL